MVAFRCLLASDGTETEHGANYPSGRERRPGPPGDLVLVADPMLALSKRTVPPENMATPKLVVPASARLGIRFAVPVTAMRSTRHDGRTTSALYSRRRCTGSSPRKNRRVNSAQRKPGRISIFRRTGASVGFQAR